MHKLQDLNLPNERILELHEEMVEWYNAVQKIEEMKPIVARERELRKKIFETLFPDYVEGAGNKCVMPDGFTMQANVSITRKVDKPSLIANSAMFRQKGIDVDDLVETDPKLNVAKYKKLDKELKNIFQQCVIEKPGSTALALKAPPKAKEQE